MNRTGIEYLDFTWNPIAMRCTPVGPGCTNCWHLAMADRLAGNSAFPNNVRAAYAGKGPPVLVEKRLNEPLRRKEPALIGVQFMGDLLHEDVSNRMIYDVFRMMFMTPEHTYLVLTKRIGRLYELMVRGWLDAILPDNVWPSVSVENQATADERIPLLLETPAAKRVVSYEPALSPVDFRPYLEKSMLCDHHGRVPASRWMTTKGCGICLEERIKDEWGNTPSLIRNLLPGLDGIICGGESGPGARPMKPQWARDVRDQCQEAGVPFFMKQMSKKAPIPDDLMIREFPV